MRKFTYDLAVATLPVAMLWKCLVRIWMSQVLLSAAIKDTTRSRHIRMRSSRDLVGRLSKGRGTKG